jgi:hypothetical protein
LENSNNESGHQVDQSLLLQRIDLMMYWVIFIAGKVEAVLIHGMAPKRQTRALQQNN